MSEEPPPPPVADPADVDSLDAIITAVYDSVSFAQGTRPDWERFRSLFQATAVMVRVDPHLTNLPIRERTDAALQVNLIADYVAQTTAAVEAGKLEAFTERELTRRTEVFADLAQVFSTYERFAGEDEPTRGINSMQLVKDGTRWWIVSMSWTDEREPGQLPTRYLPRG